MNRIRFVRVFSFFLRCPRTSQVVSGSLSPAARFLKKLTQTLKRDGTDSMNRKPWLEGPTTEDRAKSRMWQGGICFLLGALFTGGSQLALGMVWLPTVFLAVAGLFWFLVGLVTWLTGYE